MIIDRYNETSETHFFRRHSWGHKDRWNRKEKKQSLMEHTWKVNTMSLAIELALGMSLYKSTWCETHLPLPLMYDQGLLSLYKHFEANTMSVDDGVGAAKEKKYFMLLLKNRWKCCGSTTNQRRSYQRVRRSGSKRADKRVTMRREWTVSCHSSSPIWRRLPFSLFFVTNSACNYYNTRKTFWSTYVESTRRRLSKIYG